jgi:hypothetical protein
MDLSFTTTVTVSTPEELDGHLSAPLHALENTITVTHVKETAPPVHGNRWTQFVEIWSVNIFLERRAALVLKTVQIQ